MTAATLFWREIQTLCQMDAYKVTSKGIFLSVNAWTQYIANQMIIE